jgi:hypothetical protein
MLLPLLPPPPLLLLLLPPLLVGAWLVPARGAFRAAASFASPLKWLLNGSPRAAPGLDTPLDEPDQGQDGGTRNPRFSRAPHRRHQRRGRPP